MTQCNFGDANKIRAMLSDKYQRLEVKENRHALSSLNNIEIYTDDRLLLRLEPTSDDGYIVKCVGDYLTLDFIDDVFKCIAN